MQKPYDVVVIGAGVAGAFTAYFLGLEGKSVAVIDDNTYAKGSAAAGAFLTPKLAQGGELKALVNQAFLHAIAFYSKHVPRLLNQCGIEHILKENDTVQYSFEKSIKATQTPNAVHFAQGGIVDAVEVLNFLLKESTHIQQKATTLNRSDGVWVINQTLHAKKVVLAQGAHPLKLLDIPYLTIRPVWGERITISSSTPLNYGIHDAISIAPDNKGNVVVGATHIQNASFSTEPTLEAVQTLLNDAQKMIQLSNVNVQSTYAGFRAASSDYLPILGAVIDEKRTLSNYPRIIKGQKVAFKLCSVHEDIFILNGLGARGFVLGPMLGQMLAQQIVANSKVDDTISTYRRFLKWARKEHNKGLNA